MISNKELENIYQLKNIVRYNNKLRLKTESVAEHSYYVSLIALKICDKLNISDDIKLKVLIKAILHDLPEIEINDITHDAKVKLNLYKFLEDFENDYYSRNYNQYLELMKDNSDTLINTIVKLADIYSVIQYLNNEISLGNISCIEMKTETTKRLDELLTEIKKYEKTLDGSN